MTVEFTACVLQNMYEAYGIGGTAFLIECLTDNANRTSADVKTAVVKGGGKVQGLPRAPPFHRQPCNSPSPHPPCRPVSLCPPPPPPPRSPPQRCCWGRV